MCKSNLRLTIYDHNLRCSVLLDQQEQAAAALKRGVIIFSSQAAFGGSEYFKVESKQEFLYIGVEVE